MRKICAIVFLPLLLLSMWLAAPAMARPQTQAPSSPPANFKAVHVIGLEGVKHNAKGKVTVTKDNIEFARGSTKSNLPIASIQDALTGTDSQRMVGGTIGFLTQFAPYESGRFLSLFRVNIDTLTISYRDPGGGLHGVIFTLPEGQAALLKKELVDQGAKTSVSVADAPSTPSSGSGAKEKRP